MMKKIALGLTVAFLASACGSTKPEERYLDAIQKKLDGDQRGFYDDMMTLAVEESDTRAGRRARAAVSGGVDIITLAGVAGVLAAIAVPNFLKFQAKAKQSSVKSGLRSLFTSQMAYFAENGRYCRSFQECGMSDAYLADGPYMYFIGDDVLSSQPSYEVQQAYDLMNDLGITPVVTDTGFVIVAVGNIDTDSDLDVWTIDDSNLLYNVVSDP